MQTQCYRIRSRSPSAIGSHKPWRDAEDSRHLQTQSLQIRHMLTKPLTWLSKSRAKINEGGLPKSRCVWIQRDLENMMAWMKNWETAFKHKAMRVGLKNSQQILSQLVKKGSSANNLFFSPPKNCQSRQRCFKLCPLSRIFSPTLSSKLRSDILYFSEVYFFFSGWCFLILKIIN